MFFPYEYLHFLLKLLVVPGQIFRSLGIAAYEHKPLCEAYNETERFNELLLLTYLTIRYLPPSCFLLGRTTRLLQTRHSVCVTFAVFLFRSMLFQCFRSEFEVWSVLVNSFVRVTDTLSGTMGSFTCPNYQGYGLYWLQKIIYCHKSIVL